MEQNKRGGKRAYLKDFRKTASGEYIYTGKHMVYSPGNALPFKKYFVGLCVFNAVSVVSAAASGFLPMEGLKNCIYIILPLVIEFVLTAWSLYRILFSGVKSDMRLYAFENAFKGLAVRNTAAMIFSCAGAAGCILFALIKRPAGELIWQAAYILLKTVAALCQFFSRRGVKNALWTET